MISPPPPTPPRVRARKREGRCYELAFSTLLNDDAEGWALVHGEVRGPPEGPPIVGHAWLARDGWVFDVVRKELLSADIYMRRSLARVLAIYEKTDACRRMIAEGHYGPWEPE